MQVVAIVNGSGAAGPLDVVEAAAGWCTPVVVDSSAEPAGQATLAMLADLIACVDLAGRSPAAVADELEVLGVCGITTFSDDRIAQTADLAERLGLPYHCPATAAALRGKDEQRRRLNAAGVSTTRYAVVNGPADIPAAVARVGLPAVLKPIASSGSAFACRVDTADDIARELAAAGTLDSMPAAVQTAAHAPRQLEELLTGGAHPAGDWLGDYVSVEILTLGPGEHRHLCVTDRLPVMFPFRETGLLLPSQLPPDRQAEVCALAARALDALDVRTGLSHVEIKLTPAGPRVLEVNGRLGGFVPHLLGWVSTIGAVRLALAAAAGVVSPGDVPDGDVPDGFTGYALAYLVHAPADVRVVRDLADPATLARVPGVRRVERHVTPGSPADFRTGTHGRLQTVWISTETPEALRKALVAVDELLATGNIYG